MGYPPNSEWYEALQEALGCISKSHSIALLKRLHFTVHTNTKHTKTKKSQHPTREPTLKKQEKILSFPQSAAAVLRVRPSAAASAICCCRAVVMLLPCCVQPSTAASTICCRRAASSHREETAARSAVRKLLLHAHRSAVENPAADLLLQGLSSNPTRVSPLVPYVF